MHFRQFGDMTETWYCSNPQNMGGVSKIKVSLKDSFLGRNQWILRGLLSLTHSLRILWNPIQSLGAFVPRLKSPEGSGCGLAVCWPAEFFRLWAMKRFYEQVNKWFNRPTGRTYRTQVEVVTWMFDLLETTLSVFETVVLGDIEAHMSNLRLHKIVDSCRDEAKEIDPTELFCIYKHVFLTWVGTCVLFKHIVCIHTHRWHIQVLLSVPVTRSWVSKQNHGCNSLTLSTGKTHVFLCHALVYFMCVC